MSLKRRVDKLAGGRLSQAARAYQVHLERLTNEELMAEAQREVGRLRTGGDGTEPASVGSADSLLQRIFAHVSDEQLLADQAAYNAAKKAAS